MFSPHAWGGNLGRRDLDHEYDGGLASEMLMIRKFYKKYPEVRYMSLTGPIEHSYGGQMRYTHPASHFITKQKKYMKQGYTEHKAFEMAEADLSGMIEKQRDEARILRGVALDKDALSYVDRFQMVAEMESQLKVKRLERDMPKFLRAQRNYINDFEREVNSIKKKSGVQSDFASPEEEYKYHRETIEYLMSDRYDYESEQKFEKYQPVLYEVIKDPKQLADRESLAQTHDKFMDRTEKIL